MSTISFDSEVSYPELPLLRSYIELYRHVRLHEDVEGLTIANARVDLTLVLQGEVEVAQNGEYTKLPDLTVFPLTRDGANSLRIPAGTELINIKLYPHVLTRPVLQQVNERDFLSWQKLFGNESVSKLILGLNPGDGLGSWTSILDSFFEEHLLGDDKGERDLVSEVINQIEEGETEELSLKAFSEQKGISSKTLERRFKKVTGLSTKMYLDLVKFQRTVKRIHGEAPYAHGDLLEALGTGYYDQSHFVKACRKLTGKNPKTLFASLPAQLTDFMLLED